jgi:hypothetical protein
MTVIEIAYVICASIMLPGPVPLMDNILEYDLYTNDEYDITLTHPANIIEVCKEDYPQVFICEPGVGCYIKSDYYYTASNDAGVSEPSPKLEVRWVWDADFNDDGIVGFPDFFLFAQAFGTDDPLFDSDGDGIVGFSDFSAFAVRFSECLSEGLVKVVPCAR